jgi:hypothetical protein
MRNSTFTFGVEEEILTEEWEGKAMHGAESIIAQW